MKKVVDVITNRYGLEIEVEVVLIDKPPYEVIDLRNAAKTALYIDAREFMSPADEAKAIDHILEVGIDNYIKTKGSLS